MRIGIDASFLDPAARYTGMGVYTRGLLQGLAQAVGSDDEVHLLGIGERPPTAPAPFEWHGVAQLPVGRAAPWLSHQVTLPLLARRLRLDVLHATGVNLRLSRPGVPLATPCPLVVTVHDAIPVTYYGRQGPALPWRLRAGYRVAMAAAARASAVITVSEYARSEILAALPLRPERVTVVHNGLPELPVLDDAQRAQAWAGMGMQPPYLLYVGSYEPRKNALGAIDAYAHAAALRCLPPLVLVVERDSGHRTDVLASAAQTGVADRLRWLHSLTDEQMAALLAGASAFLFPSLAEGFGFTPLQAMAAGVPVVAGNTGAAPEVLGEAALLTNPRNPQALAHALNRVLFDPAERQRLQTNGRAQAARYRWQKAAAETLAVYRRAAAEGR